MSIFVVHFRSVIHEDLLNGRQLPPYGQHLAYLLPTGNPAKSFDHPREIADRYCVKGLFVEAVCKADHLCIKPKLLSASSID